MPPDRPPCQAAHKATHHSWHTEPYFVPPCILDFYFENRLLFNICSQCIQRCLHSGAAQQMLLLLGGGRIAKRIRYGYSWYHTVYANRLGNRKKVTHKYNRETCALKFFTIVDPQRVQVPQVETMMTASTWSSFRSGMISLAILLASPCVVPVPTVE